ncbi:uncharacterized protein [Chelonus insularis]|uniref:uncharacterized protein n=1 Tax=Chelonus insularis TaxID=460826 RepID=UPI00158DB7CA|nr:uncharacterized protein LOC118072733 [Chelonus insularis]
MKNVLVTVFIIGLFTTAFSGSIKEDLTIVRTCNMTDPVDINILNDYLIYHNPNHLNPKQRQELSCFLLCVYSEFNWMDRHGGFKVNNIKSWMRKTELSEHDIDNLIRKCITPEFTDPCTRAQYFTECFWANYQGSLKSRHHHSLHSIIHKNNFK